jgi:hypothetical protein
MGAVYATRRLNSGSAFANKVEKLTAKKVAKLLDQMADEVVVEANRLIDKELVTDRSNKRRKGRQRHLKGSIYVVPIDVEAGFPITITVASRAEGAKAAALEFGSRPHFIEGRNRPDKMLIFPSTRQSYELGRGQSIVRLEGKGPTSLKRSNAYNRGRGEKMVVTHRVWHPGNEAYGFLAKALENVAKRRLKGAKR